MYLVTFMSKLAQLKAQQEATKKLELEVDNEIAENIKSFFNQLCEDYELDEKIGIEHIKKALDIDKVGAQMCEEFEEQQVVKTRRKPNKIREIQLPNKTIITSNPGRNIEIQKLVKETDFNWRDHVLKIYDKDNNLYDAEGNVIGTVK